MTFPTFQTFANALADKCGEWYLGLDGEFRASFTYLDKKGLPQYAEEDHQIKVAFLAELTFHAPYCSWVPLLVLRVLPCGRVGWRGRWSAEHGWEIDVLADWKTDPDALDKAHAAIRQRVLSHDPSCWGEYREEFCKQCGSHGVRSKVVKEGTTL